MDTTIDVIIPVDAETAEALATPARREAAGRLLSDLLRAGGVRKLLAEAIDGAKHEARLNGLTDDDVDAELEAWRRERHA